MDKIDEQKEMEQVLSAMSEHQRDHLKIIIKSLIQCYQRDDRHGLLLIGSDKKETLTIIAINADEMSAANLLSAADEYINFRALEEAPPKELFN
jgi:hypothetical protein